MTYTVYHNDKIVKDKDLTPFPFPPFPFLRYQDG